MDKMSKVCITYMRKTISDVELPHPLQEFKDVATAVTSLNSFSIGANWFHYCEIWQDLLDGKAVNLSHSDFATNMVFSELKEKKLPKYAEDPESDLFLNILWGESNQTVCLIHSDDIIYYNKYIEGK